MNQYFFENILPRTDKRTLVIAFETDALFSQIAGTCDYGLDLDLLQEEQGGNIDYGIKFTNQNLPPTPAQVSYRNEFVGLLKQKMSKKADVIPMDFFGTQASGYTLRDLKIYRGKGAERAGTMFHRIVTRSHIKDAVPIKARKRLDKGPREASLNFGPF